MGLVSAPVSRYLMMADRSYVKPSCAITGSTSTDRVMGQHKSSSVTVMLTPSKLGSSTSPHDVEAGACPRQPLLRSEGLSRGSCVEVARTSNEGALVSELA